MTDKQIRAVEVTFDVLNALGELDNPTPTDIAEHLEMPVSTIHGYLTTLTHRGLVTKNNGRYSLGGRLLSYGSRMLDSCDLYNAARPSVDRLARTTGEMSSLAINEQGSAVFLYFQKETDEYDLTIYPGVATGFLQCASGKAILAHMPTDRWSEHVRSEESKEELRTIQSQGFSIHEYERGVMSIAAPIVTDETVLGAVSISAPSIRVNNPSFREEATELVTEAANLIAINLDKTLPPGTE